MCGIAGIVSLGGRPVHPAAVVRMCDALAHRGPDDAGYAFFDADGGRRHYVDEAFRHLHPDRAVLDRAAAERDGGRAILGLGHRRLSVLDVTTGGHQPMTGPGARCAMAHNGEVYNFRELRAELEGRGHTFATRTDTEVLLALWAERGPEALACLDGMFAFAIYDRQDNTLTLARDRFGVKPLYYARVDGALVFASEPKALFASGLLDPTFDPEALVEYFTFQNLYGRRTLWREVEILGPGETLTVRPGAEGEPVLGRFHSGFPEMDPGLTDTEGVIQELAGLFERAVRRQLVSDVPVGSYLSGGMDSGSIVAVAGRSIPRLHSFTGGFDLTNVNGIEQGFDERRLAEQLSYLLQTEHYDVVLHAGDMPAAMEQITWHTRTGTWPSSPASSSRSAWRARVATSCSPATRGATASPPAPVTWTGSTATTTATGTGCSGPRSCPGSSRPSCVGTAARAGRASAPCWALRRRGATGSRRSTTSSSGPCTSSSRPSSTGCS
jgi:asparagine synthase (glutamine-hydrolysing)